jgi:hypothetical protein
LLCRYLLDTDQDVEGLKVIADFHNGDLEDPISKAEFRAIKEAVLADVRVDQGSDRLGPVD